MIPSSVWAFHAEVQRLARRHFPRSKWELQELNLLRLQLRIILSPEIFIEVFHSARTQRISFALIKKEERIFGIDNLHGWHRHPFGGVEQHQAIKEPALAEIFTETNRVIVEESLLVEGGKR